MVRLRPEHYAPGTAAKLHTRSTSPFRVLSRIGENAYVVDIPHLWGISSTFNVADRRRTKLHLFRLMSSLHLSALSPDPSLSTKLHSPHFTT